ncbi:MAG: 50S ribosomal protein L21 [Eubacteriales bacterium]|nr:50S ribosomal protein L21 [Eubacteriales bacterium]
MYAVLASGGKQYKVSEGDELFIEKIEGEVGNQVELPVLAVSNGEGLKFENELGSATVKCEILKQGKHKKILVMKYKPKKNYRRKNGHRQPYTKIRVSAINL